MSEAHGADASTDGEARVVAALPGLARVAATASWRIATWAVTTSTLNTARLVKAIASGEPPTKIMSDVSVSLRVAALHLLGLATADADSASASRAPGASPDELRARGAALLHDSADVWFEEDTHPAYARILDELTPDEARILRFLATDGPQPAVDVRTSRPLGVGSELVAAGLSMIGLESGVRNEGQTRANLNNLHRLGLIWFSREQVSDPTTYQVVEVQPDVAEAKKRAGRSSKVVHRSIHLTPFGEDFCETCLPGANGSKPGPGLS